MLPPVLEIYVVWHPGDDEGRRLADALLEHYHGTPYAGLVGGAVEVYARSARWDSDSDAPRPLPFQVTLPSGPAARVTAVIPVVGVRLARAVEDEHSGWRGYLENLLVAARASPDRIGIFPIRLAGTADGTLACLLRDLQQLDEASAGDPAVLCREVSQAIAQLIGDGFGDRLTVFISHTVRHSAAEEPGYVDAGRGACPKDDRRHPPAVVFRRRRPATGGGLGSRIAIEAASSALLAVRTDLYAGRQWCQREFRIAKQAGMPVVTLNAVRHSEERGSFLMDHVPTVRYDDRDAESRRRSIEAALNLLVDGALRRAIWNSKIRIFAPRESTGHRFTRRNPPQPSPGCSRTESASRRWPFPCNAPGSAAGTG